MPEIRLIKTRMEGADAAAGRSFERELNDIPPLYLRKGSEKKFGKKKKVSSEARGGLR